MARCRIYTHEDGFEYLIPACGGCIAGDEIMYMGAREFVKIYCTCSPPDKRQKSEDKREIEHLHFMLNNQQQVIFTLLKRIGELKKVKL